MERAYTLAFVGCVDCTKGMKIRFRANAVLESKEESGRDTLQFFLGEFCPQNRKRNLEICKIFSDARTLESANWILRP